MPFDSSTLPPELELPVFKPRRNQARLDFRPVVWSLRNRPEEWMWDSGHYCIVHKPSAHEFWVANGVSYYRLRRADGCSCNQDRSRPSLADRWRFHFAFKAWQRLQVGPAVNQQFAAHFLTARRTDVER